MPLPEWLTDFVNSICSLEVKELILKQEKPEDNASGLHWRSCPVLRREAARPEEIEGTEERVPSLWPRAAHWSFYVCAGFRKAARTIQ